MKRPLTMTVLLLAGIACTPGAHTRPTAGQVSQEGASNQVGRYHLTKAESMAGSRDSIYRYSDGTAATVSVIRYDVPDDVKVGQDSQSWTAREGAKFARLQDVLVQQGRSQTYELAFMDTSEVAAGQAVITEHATAVAVRTSSGIHMDFQYLYLVGGRFLKVRGTFPGESWKTSEFPNFAREVVRRAHRAAAR